MNSFNYESESSNNIESKSVENWLFPKPEQSNMNFNIIYLEKELYNENEKYRIDLNMHINSYMEDILKPDDKKTNEGEIDGKSKYNSIFKINKMPYSERDINAIIKKMNINEEMKHLLILNDDENCEELKKLRN